MTATELSPDELIRSRAFFDAAEFAEIVGLPEGIIPCGFPDCEKEATVRIVRICCSRQWLTCATHLERHRARTERKLAEPRHHRCTFCDHRYAPGSGFSDIYRVVPL